MRLGEILGLTWSMFDRETWTLRLHARAAKTGKGRILALEGPLRTIIERRLKRRSLECPLIFHRRIKGKDAQPIGEFRKTWRTALQAANLAPFKFHDLRRSAVRNMIRAGVHQSVAMRISGHETDSMFRRYNIVDEPDLRDAMRKTADYISTLPITRNVVPIAAVGAGSKPNPYVLPHADQTPPPYLIDSQALSECARWGSNPQPRA